MRTFLFYKNAGNLTDIEKNVYDIIREGINGNIREIQFNNTGKITENRIVELYNLAALDSATAFVNRERFGLATLGGLFYRVMPEYLVPQENITGYRKEISAKLNPAIARIAKLSTDEEKELAVHDLILRNVKYVNANDKLDHSILKAVLSGTAVCDGISYLAKFLFDAVGIPSGVVTGKGSAVNSLYYDPKLDSSGSNGLNEGHAWNLVMINKKWYHLDITYDLGLSDGLKTYRYDYFNLPDRNIGSDHILESDLKVSCHDTDAFYYKKRGCYAPDSKELKSILRKAKAQTRGEFTFQIPYIKNREEAFNKIAKVCFLETGRIPQKFNPTQMVFTIDL